MTTYIEYDGTSTCDVAPIADCLPVGGAYEVFPTREPVQNQTEKIPKTRAADHI